MKIYHNPKCSKSRDALALLKKKGADPEVIEYIKTPLTREELKRIVEKLGVSPMDIVRTDEPIWKREFTGIRWEDDALFGALVEYPILLQRPIVINGKRAVIARPPERALELL